MAEVNYNDLVLKELNYNSYLKLPELLSLQEEISQPKHHDEMFFIIIHQAAELWFKLMLHETETLVESFRDGMVSRALKALKRITRAMNLQVQQIRMLSTLTPVEFAGFRNFLRPASGFQSAQWRIIEFTFGVREPFFLRFFEKMPEIRGRLEDILKHPSVYDECLRCLHRDDHPIPEEVRERDFSKPWVMNEELVSVIQDVYESPKEHYHWVLLFEAMIDLDEAFELWRKTHAVMVNRTIGFKTGTGGSAGYNFLKSRENTKCFPELWEVRNRIGGTH
ncbi:MAG: tryptophan 2,3-dioxygenase family protein [Acidobacteriota bacterium]|nr:tryptophan 2,3-dioxygenase family protein [Acidobacteriota bacterium]